MRSASFQSELRSGHKGDAAHVPFDPGVRWSIRANALWPGRRGFPVRATLNDVAFDSAIVSRSRMFWLLVPAEASASAKVSTGELCSFAVTPDHSASVRSPRGHAAPGRGTA